jgi:hypothetical protein
VRTGSRGLYWLEPMVEVVVAAGRIAYGPVTAADAEGVLDAALGGDDKHPLHLGRPEDICFLNTQTRLTFVRCGIVDPRALDDYRAHDGGKGLGRALQMPPAAVIEEVTQSGLRGRGGAGFPTGIKWKTVAETAADLKYIVCNADEGDSGTYADRMIMEGDPFVLIEGMTIAGIAVGATQGFVYVRSEYPHAIAGSTTPFARRGAAACWVATSLDRCSRSIWRSASVPAPMCAVRRPRCWTAWKASARWFVPSRRCRRTRAIRQADRHQQCPLARLCPDHSRKGRGILPRFRHGQITRHHADPARGERQVSWPLRDGVRRHPW